MSDPGQKPPGEPEFGMFAGLSVGAAIWLGIEILGLWLKGLTMPWAGALVYMLPKHFFPRGIGAVPETAVWRASVLSVAHICWWVGLVLGITAGGAIFWWLATPSSGVRHLRGRQLRQGAALAKQEARAEGKPTGVYLHPKIQLTERRETRHFFIGGASGSGKTTVIQPVYEQACARGDKLVVWDFKGDIWQAGGRAVLLAPWDRRSARWVPGGDINTIPRARALAEFLIPARDGANPMWEQGAQQILVSVISAFLPRAWAFAELGSAMRRILTDMDELKSIINDEMPEAKRIVESGKPSESVLFTLSAWFAAVFDLAEADRSLEQAGRPPLVLRDWLAHKNSAPLIFRPNPDDPPEGEGGAAGLGRQFNALVINMLAQYVLMMPDTPPEQRRIWFFLDEVSHIAKLNVITELLEAGRSKGARVILGLQEPSQVTKKYSPETLRIWENTTATKILVQMVGADAQDWASRQVGEREVERYVGQMSGAANWGSNQQASRSSSWQRAEERLLLPGEFAQIVQPNAQGVRGVLLMSGDAHLLTWPHLKIEPTRTAFEPATWTLPGWQRAHRASAAPPRPDGDEGHGTVIDQPKRPMSTRPTTGGQAKQRPPAQAEIAPVSAPAQTPAPDRVATSEVAPTPTPDEPAADVVSDQVQDAALDHVAPGLGSAIEAAGEIAAALGSDPTAPFTAPAAGLPARRKWRRRASAEQDREPD